VKTRLAAAVINADSRQSLHKSQQRKWHKNTLKTIDARQVPIIKTPGASSRHSKRT